MVATAGAAARPVARRWRCRRRPRTALGTCAARSRCPPPRPRPWTACLWPCGLSAGSRLVASGEDANRSSCVSVGRWSLERTPHKTGGEKLRATRRHRCFISIIGQTCKVSCDSHTEPSTEPHSERETGKSFFPCIDSDARDPAVRPLVHPLPPPTLRTREDGCSARHRRRTRKSPRRSCPCPRRPRPHRHPSSRTLRASSVAGASVR